MSIVSREEGGIKRIRSFCFKCQTNRLILNNQCCQCKCIIQYEVINNNLQSQEGIMNHDQHPQEGHKETQSFEYTFSDEYSDSNTNPINNNKHNEIEIRNNSPISSYKKRSQKRKANFNHYETAHHRDKKQKTIIELDMDENDEIIDLTSSDDENNDIDLKVNEIIHPDFTPCPSRSQASSLSTSTQGNYTTRKPASQTSLSGRFNRLHIESGYISDSASVSIISQSNSITLQFEGRIMDKWRQLHLKDTTLQALEMLPDLQIPLRDGITLLNQIRAHDFKHAICSMVNYEQRVFYIVIAIMEIIRTDFNMNGNHNYNNNRKPQIMVVSARRHSAERMAEVMREIGRFAGVLVTSVIGGMKSFDCLRRLSKGLDVITGTPGKYCEMIRKNAINKNKMHNLLAFVMDDADELVNSHSMRAQMRNITRVLPDRKIKVLWLESVTNDASLQTAKREIRHIDKDICNMTDERRQISVIKQTQSLASTNVHIIAPVTDMGEKKKALYECLRLYKGSKHIIIFFNLKSDLRKVFDEYMAQNDSVLPRRKRFVFVMDGNERSNIERKHVIDNFTEDGGILMCSDLFARGISFPINVCINFDIPQNIHRYIARVGCAKYKTPVLVINLVLEKYNKYEATLDEQMMDELRMKFGVQMKMYKEYTKERKENRNMRFNGIF